MTKVIKLKESDIQRIVKKVLNEQEVGSGVPGVGKFIDRPQFDKFIKGLFKNGPIKETYNVAKNYREFKSNTEWNTKIDSVFNNDKNVVGLTEPLKSREYRNGERGVTDQAQGLAMAGADLKNANVRGLPKFVFYQGEGKDLTFYAIVAPCTEETCKAR